MSTGGAKGSLRADGEKRGRRRRKGRKGERERESKRSGEKAKGQMLVLPEEDTHVGREDRAGQGEGGSQHVHRRRLALHHRSALPKVPLS